MTDCDKLGSIICRLCFAALCLLDLVLSSSHLLRQAIYSTTYLEIPINTDITLLGLRLALMFDPGDERCIHVMSFWRYVHT